MISNELLIFLSKKEFLSVRLLETCLIHPDKIIYQFSKLFMKSETFVIKSFFFKFWCHYILKNNKSDGVQT